MSLLGWFLKVYLFIIVLLFNLQEFLLIKISGIEFLSYFDELVALSAYILGPLILRKKKDLWVLALLLFPLFSILHGIILDGFIWQSGRYIEVIVQSVINFKFFLYFVVFYCFYESSIKAQRSIFDFFCLLILISILGAILNVILPENFVYSTYEYALERKRLIGFQFKPNDLSILFSFLICLALIIKHHKIKIKSLYLTRFVSVVLFVLILLSTARTAIMIVMILVLGTVIFGRNKSYTVIVLILGCILGLLASGKLSQTFVISETFSNFKEFNNINNSQYIRFIMLYYAFIIGSSYLFGVGAGNYGSVMSVDSPVYIEYGLAKISFFEIWKGSMIVILPQSLANMVS